MRLYKPKYKDKKGKTKQVEKWWLEFRDPNGIVQRWSLGTTDQSVAEIIVSQLNLLNEWAKIGLAPKPDIVKWVQGQSKKLRNKIYKAGLLQAEQANITKTLNEHLADFIADLEVGVSDRSRHPERVEYNIKRIMAGCGIEYWSDVDGSKIRKFLKAEGLNEHNAQHFIKSFRAFSIWLMDNERITKPLKIKSFDYEVPPQRHFEKNELMALYEVAENGSVVKWLTGHQRNVLYRLAFESGLRREELRSLTPASFDFDKCIVYVSKENTKNKKRAEQKITPGTMAMVKDLVKNLMPTARVFDLHVNTAIMIRVDAKAAGIEIENWQGKIKFHTLRHSLATHLVSLGNPPNVVQKIMRHADIKTTMKYYTHLLRGDEDKAISGLVGFGEQDAKQQTA